MVAADSVEAVDLEDSRNKQKPALPFHLSDCNNIGHKISLHIYCSRSPTDNFPYLFTQKEVISENKNKMFRNIFGEVWK